MLHLPKGHVALTNRTHSTPCSLPVVSLMHPHYTDDAIMPSYNSYHFVLHQKLNDIWQMNSCSWAQAVHSIPANLSPIPHSLSCYSVDSISSNPMSLTAPDNHHNPISDHHLHAPCHPQTDHIGILSKQAQPPVMINEFHLKPKPSVQLTRWAMQIPIPNVIYLLHRKQTWRMEQSARSSTDIHRICHD